MRRSWCPGPSNFAQIPSYLRRGTRLSGKRREPKYASLSTPSRSDSVIDRGAVRDCADVARRLGLSRARISQLLDLTLLAPDIQTEVLAIEAG